ncbi:MAG: preprotein translocase subunit SecG [Lentisphaerales bacterium]|jgi:preprotein translocase subunit SecG|nr:MAG: preprotein translocase subunit SecG [Lentisphaerales bacterium]
MHIIRFLLLGVEVIIGLLLVGIILLQRSKDQGLGLAFGAGMGEALFGARAADVLTKTTVVLTVIFMLNTIVLARLFSVSEGQTSIMGSVPIPQAQPQGPGMPGGMPAEMPPGEVRPAGTESLPGETAIPVDLGGIEGDVAPVTPAPEVPVPIE